MKKDDWVDVFILLFFVVWEAVVSLFWICIAAAVVVLAYQLGYEMGVDGLTWADIIGRVDDG